MHVLKAVSKPGVIYNMCARAARNSHFAPSHNHDMRACAFQADSACKASKMSGVFVKHATPVVSMSAPISALPSSNMVQATPHFPKAET